MTHLLGFRRVRALHVSVFSTAPAHPRAAAPPAPGPLDTGLPALALQSPHVHQACASHMHARGAGVPPTPVGAARSRSRWCSPPASSLAAPAVACRVSGSPRLWWAQLSCSSDVHSVRLSRRSCMMSVESLYDSSSSVSSSAMASSKACLARSHASCDLDCTSYRKTE